MGSCIPFIDEQPFAERVKTQQLESMLCNALHTDLALAPDYEKVIVEELFLRSSRRVRQQPLGK